MRTCDGLALLARVFGLKEVGPFGPTGLLQPVVLLDFGNLGLALGLGHLGRVHVELGLGDVASLRGLDDGVDLGLELFDLLRLVLGERVGLGHDHAFAPLAFHGVFAFLELGERKPLLPVRALEPRDFHDFLALALRRLRHDGQLLAFEEYFIAFASEF